MIMKVDSEVAKQMQSTLRFLTFVLSSPDFYYVFFALFHLFQSHRTAEYF